VSIRLRLLLATALIALVALVAADFILYSSLRSFLYGQIDNGLELSHRSVEASISGPAETGPPPPQPGSGPQACRVFHGREVDTMGLTPGTVIEVRSRPGTTVYRCALPELGPTRAPYPVVPRRITGYAPNAAPGGEEAVYFTAPAHSGDGAYRVRASILRSGPDQGGTLIVAVPLSGTDGTLAKLRAVEIAVTAIALAVVLGLGWWLVRASLHPLRDIERTADAITAGQLTERVPEDRARTEVGRLSRAFNVMLERITAAFAERDRTVEELRASEERMRRFIADASHELRTPLAAVTAYAELFDRGAAERPEDLRRVMEGIQRESSRMGHLVEDLLLLARLDEGRPLRLEPIDLVAVVAESVATARTLGPQWPVTLDASAPVEVRADALRIRQVLDNLLTNVRVHCPRGTAAAVTVSSDASGATVDVADDGPGMGEEDLLRVFERFFRADASRSREHGGAGLGLSIVDAIVRAHGGTVSVWSAPGAGTRFAIRLPLTQRPPEDPEGHAEPAPVPASPPAAGPASLPAAGPASPPAARRSP
jgi:two-component system, OmpR family, sensor kinase